jgi:glutamine amidotransferase-like uncharacterized protein
MALRKLFGKDHVAIVSSDRHHLARNIEELSPSVIILPEITGEQSFYNDHIPLKTRTLIKDHVKHGAMLVSFCAGAYWMAEEIRYTPPHGPSKIRGGKTVFNAVSLRAQGPLPGYGRPSNGQEDLGGCHTIPVLTKIDTGFVEHACWYGNGPGFYSFDGAHPDNIDVLSYYADIENNPIAAFSRPHGKGEYLVSGVLPHYHRSPVSKDNILWQLIAGRLHKQLFGNHTRPVLSHTP